MLPFRDGRFRVRSAAPLVIVFIGAAFLSHAQQSTTTPAAGAEKKRGSGGISDIPLAVGREAKGLVVPDYDSDGNLRGRFEIGAAKRLDQQHLEFTHLKMHTYGPNEQPDLTMDAAASVLDLESHVLATRERTVIKRTNIEVAGDIVELNLQTRTTVLRGRVKMSITDRDRLMEKGGQ